MRKIGFFLDNCIYKHIDFTNAVISNPGAGGTEWEFFKIAILLSEKFVVYFFATSKIIGSYPFSIIYADNLEQALSYADDLDVEIMIHRFQQNTVNAHKCKRILWLHNDISFEHMNREAKTKQVRAFIFVSKSNYDKYRLNRNARRLGYVCYNAIGNLRFKKQNYSTFNVAYIGEISPYRETHRIIDLWSKIIKEIPTAHLHFFGTYSPEEKEYFDKKILSPIVNNQLEKTITFHGMVNIDKNYKLMQQMDVGIGSNCLEETFCLSMIDFERYSIPIVSLDCPIFNEIAPANCSLKYNYDNDNDFLKCILLLLSNRKLRKELGNNGFENCNLFNDENIIKMWEKVFNKDRREFKYSFLQNLIFNFKSTKLILRKIPKAILRRIPKIIRKSK